MNKRFVWTTIASFGLILFAISPILALDQVEYHALIEKEQIVMGEKVQYLVRVNYPTTTMKPAITPPTFAQFTILNEYETNKEEGTGEKRFKIYRKVWLLEPNESGNLSIASAIVTYQDPTTNLLNNGKTDIIFIDVAQSPGGSTTPVVTDAISVSSTGEAATDNKNQMILWLIIGGGILFLAIIIIIVMSRRPNNHLAEERANLILQKAIAHAEQDDLDGYNKLLSQALLNYLQEKYDIDVHVLSTDVVMEQLKKNGIDSSILTGLEYYFKAVDQAKFGGYNPDEDELIKLHSTVNQFIQVGQTIKIKKKKKPHHNKAED